MTQDSAESKQHETSLPWVDSIRIIGPLDALPELDPALVVLDKQSYGADTIKGPMEELDADFQSDIFVLFFATDDTHVNTFLRVARHFPRHMFIVHSTLDLHARAALDKAVEPYVEYATSTEFMNKAHVVLMGNDVGWEERLFVLRCREKRIPTVSLQEATNVDFDGPPWRMQWADVTFIQGVHALKRHRRQLMVLTGNPRFDDIRPLPLPDKPRVLINCNFTFGIGVDWGRSWLDQVIETAQALGLDYAVTVHPRDETDLSGIDHLLPSNAFKVHEQLAKSTILLSRDSSLPYEAALMGRHVIYYNPFKEPEYWLNHDDTGLIEQCYTQEELQKTLSISIQAPVQLDDKIKVLRNVFTGLEGLNHARVARGLEVLAQRSDDWRPTDARAHSLEYTIIQMHLQNTWRPRLRKIAPLRWLWKAGKWAIGRYRR